MYQPGKADFLDIQANKLLEVSKETEAVIKKKFGDSVQRDEY